MHEEVNQILAQQSEGHFQLLGLNSKPHEFNYEFAP